MHLFFAKKFVLNTSVADFCYLMNKVISIFLSANLAFLIWFEKVKLRDEK